MGSCARRRGFRVGGLSARFGSNTGRAVARRRQRIGRVQVDGRALAGVSCPGEDQRGGDELGARMVHRVRFMFRVGSVGVCLRGRVSFSSRAVAGPRVSSRSPRSPAGSGIRSLCHARNATARLRSGGRRRTHVNDDRRSVDPGDDAAPSVRLSSPISV